MEKHGFTKFTKVDEDQGLVMGFAIVCCVDGEPYFDLQGDHIPEDAMLKAAVEFMENSRKAKEMHAGDSVGEILFCFPMTAEVAKAHDIITKTTGLMVAMKPSDDEILEKFRSGEYTGFSMGGKYLENEDA